MIASIKKYRRIILACVITALVIAYFNWGSAIQWFYTDRHIKNIEIQLNTDGKGCVDPRAVYIKITNNSSRALKEVKIYPKLTEVGFTKKLNGDFDIVSYKIISPKESYGFCSFLFGIFNWTDPLDISSRNLEIEKTQIVFMP